LHADNLTADSALFQRLRTTYLNADSADIDSATINHLYVNKFNIDGVELDNAKRFTVKLEDGSIALDGYFLSTSDVSGIA
jgi:Zn-dependent oligopeptidase